MFNLVYQSVANPSFDQTKIQDMLEHARTANDKNGITGCLLFYQGNFLQYLEGNQVKVLSLFDKIKIDSRHSDVQVLSHSYVYRREFSDWRMAYENFMGANDQMQYLKLLVESYMQKPKDALTPNPTSKSFWIAVQKLLQNKSVKNV